MVAYPPGSPSAEEVTNELDKATASVRVPLGLPAPYAYNPYVRLLKA
jgi:hypothetical protein